MVLLGVDRDGTALPVEPEPVVVRIASACCLAASALGRHQAEGVTVASMTNAWGRFRSRGPRSMYGRPFFSATKVAQQVYSGRKGGSGINALFTASRSGRGRTGANNRAPGVKDGRTRVPHQPWIASGTIGPGRQHGYASGHDHMGRDASCAMCCPAPPVVHVLVLLSVLSEVQSC